MLTLRSAGPTLEMPKKFVQLLSPLLPVADRVGAKLYLFGGFIRDLLSGDMPKDADVYVEGYPSTKFVHELMEQHIVTTKDDYIGTIPFKEDMMLALSQVEIRGFDFDFVSSDAPSIKEYLSRSDFTVNTLYYDMARGVLVDPTGYGVADINSKTLRANAKELTPMEALRAVKMAVVHGYNIEASVIPLIQAAAPQIPDAGIGFLIKLLRRIYDHDAVKAEHLLTVLNIKQYIPEIIQEEVGG